MVKKCLICGKDFQNVLHDETRKYCFECSPSYPKNSNIGRGVAVTCDAYSNFTEKDIKPFLAISVMK